MTRVLQAAASYFALVFAAGFVLALVRVPLLVPRIGERWAELLEMPLMLAVIVLAARLVVRRFRTPRRSSRLTIGAAALLMMLAAEAIVGLLLQGRTLGEYLASRDPVSGTVYIAMLVVFALMPAILRTPADPIR